MLMMDFLKLFCHKNYKAIKIKKKNYHGTSQDWVYSMHTHTLTHTHSLQHGMCADPGYIWAFSLQCVLILLSAVFHLISLIIHF